MKETKPQLVLINHRIYKSQKAAIKIIAKKMKMSQAETLRYIISIYIKTNVIG